MPLIIESYFHPFTEIANVLFPGKSFSYLENPISESSDEDIYFYTRDYLSSDIKYYFNKIYFIENEKIVGIHKTARQIKYYDMSGRLINFKKEEPKPEIIDKSDFLPQLSAQDGEHVIFPEEDEED